MKAIKTIIIVLFVAISMPLMAQTNKVQQSKNEDTRAKVEVVNGQNALVLKTGKKSQSSSWGVSNTADIVLIIEDNTYKILDSLVAGPWGYAMKMKDIEGHIVDVVKSECVF